MSSQDIIDKVQKLLALATSPNENEAKAAAAKAHALLAKYNLTLEQVEESKIQDEYAGVDKDARGSKPMEDRYIIPLLQQYFYVKAVVWRYSERGHFNKNIGYETYRRRYKFTLVGRKHNVAIACYTYDFLFRAFRSSFADLCKQHKARVSEQSAKSRRSYYHGLYLGLCDQLEANVQKALAEAKQLVVAEDPNIGKFIDGMYGKLGEARKGRKMDISNSVLRAGYEAGKEMKIAAGITGSTEQPKQVSQVLALEDKS